MDVLKNQNGIYCQIHPYHEVGFIKVSQENTFELKCSECALNESCLNNFISLQTIKYCSDEHIFGNWPPVNNNDLLKDIQTALQVNTKLIEKIEFQFDKVAQEITSFLTQQKKNIILQTISFSEEIKKMIQSYHEISNISKLKQLINLNQQNIESQIRQLQDFVSEYLQNKEKNTTILLEQMTKVKEEQLLKYNFQQLQDTTQGYLTNFTNQIKKIICFGKQPNISQLFGKFNYCNQFISGQVEVQEDHLQKKISIKKINENAQDQVYFKYNLNKEKKYVVRLKFNDDGGDGINIGLAQQSNIDNQLNFSHLAKAFGNRSQTYGGKVVQGSHFYKIEKDQIVEMRIDIKQEKLQFLDYPNYININELNDQYNLDKNETYYLAIQFFSNDNYKTCIDLIYFEEQQN
ncbi:hypothetical protein ABPG74_002629 [Tetrahymena malaccensis]